MAAMTSKFYYVCVIQYYTDQWFEPGYVLFFYTFFLNFLNTFFSYILIFFLIKTILTHWDCSTSPNLAKARARRASKDSAQAAEKLPNI